MSSKDYPNYDKIIEGLSRETFETQVEKGAAWVGTPERLVDVVERYNETVGGFEVASMQVNFNTLSVDDADRSMRLFAEEVMPRCKAGAEAA